MGSTKIERQATTTGTDIETAQSGAESDSEAVAIQAETDIEAEIETYETESDLRVRAIDVAMRLQYGDQIALMEAIDSRAEVALLP